MIDASTVPAKGNKTASRIVDDEALVFQSQAGEVRVFNKVGTVIWELIDGSRSVNDIAETLSERYEVPVETAREDACEFIETLVSHGLIKLGASQTT